VGASQLYIIYSEIGNVPEDDMQATFNLELRLAVVVSEDAVKNCKKRKQKS